MKQNITIALRADGKSELIHGPEVPFSEQRATVQRFRDSDVPEGVERVELWTRSCTKFAYKRTDPPAKPSAPAKPEQEEPKTPESKPEKSPAEPKK